MESHHPPSGRSGSGQHHKPRNYKLLQDPFLVRGAPKVYRYDGVPSDPSFPAIRSLPPDPRPNIPKRWARLEPQDIPVPRFKVKFSCTSFLSCLFMLICPSNSAIGCLIGFIPGILVQNIDR